MTRPRPFHRRHHLAVAATLLAAALPAGALRAQVTDLTRTAVADVRRLTFGQLCEDRFLLRNDGDREVAGALAVAGAGEQVPYTLAAHEQLEFSARGKGDVELWVEGKLVARAERQKRSCKDVQGNAAVAVAPLEVTPSEKDGRATWAGYPYYDPWFLGPWGAGWGMGAWGGLGGWGPYRGFVGVPIVVGAGGG
ncbi:MAG: hypothetical protein KJT01_07065, partial [Gemmatimonadetes bacterium]|nr:hypothetical protein [Gemmatimonadota bacterium]